ncbi:MAG TPA: N-acetyltransferase [Verrucomicrobiales bacterium]|nr:N-acetyltransferase [Verrucomicrobiales bacterium]
MDNDYPHSINHLGQVIGRVLPNWVPPEFPLHQPLEGRFCLLEPLNVDKHAKDLFAANAQDGEGKNWTYLPYGPFSTFEEYRKWMVKVCIGSDPQFYAVIHKDSREAVGVASYLRIAPGSGSIEVGHIHFSERMKRRPTATESMFLMIKKVFELGYRRYEWKCDALNAGSCSAAQRLGLSFEGVFHQATVYKGRNRDTAWFAAVDADWPALDQVFTQWLNPSNFDENGNQHRQLSKLTQPLLRNECRGFQAANNPKIEPSY